MGVAYSGAVNMYYVVHSHRLTIHAVIASVWDVELAGGVHPIAELPHVEGLPLVPCRERAHVARHDAQQHGHQIGSPCEATHGCRAVVRMPRDEDVLV